MDNSSTSIVDFDVFPNPSSGTFKIKYLSSSKLPINVTVADLAGRKVYQKQFESTNNFNKNIELINLVPGIYILYIEDGNRTKEKKIVIH